jgi:hypothetical protein
MLGKKGKKVYKPEKERWCTAKDYFAWCIAKGFLAGSVE